MYISTEHGELVGVYLALELVVREIEQGDHIRDVMIDVDNQGAILAIRNPRPKLESKILVSKDRWAP